MGVFTVLGEPEMVELADAFGLGAVRGFRAIAAGTINSNFEVTTECGAFFVRINEGKAELDVAWEARLVAALAAGGVATPAPMIAGDGRPYALMPGSIGKWVSVFPWRDGVHLAPDEVTEAHAARLGAQLARLHVAGLELPAAWRRGSIYDHEHLVGRYDRIATVSDPQLAHAIRLLGEELAACSDASAVRRRATTGMIHGDLFRDNVLWAGPEITAILDFEQASGGSLAYDLAVCINDWCWDPLTAAPRCPLARAMLAGYAARPAAARGRPPRRFLARSPRRRRRASRSRASRMSIWHACRTPKRTSVPFWRVSKLGGAPRLAN